MTTHENFIDAIHAAAMARVNEQERMILSCIKLVYGAGETGLRGVTYYHRWAGKDRAPAPFVEVCAFGQSSLVQIAGTTLHELAHVLAGWGAGHGPDWKAACERLGLRCAKASGTRYSWANLAPGLRELVYGLPAPDEGAPVAMLGGGAAGAAVKPCTAGFGTRGGKSRGPGSGSRMRLFVCECEPPVKVRAARDNLAARCLCCDQNFRAG